MTQPEEGKLLRIFIGEADQYHHSPLFEAIVRKAKEMNMRGATVLRGIEGFGANSMIHKAHLLDLSADLPVVVEIVDTEANINLLLPVVNDMITQVNAGAMVTIEKATIINYQPSKK